MSEFTISSAGPAARSILIERAGTPWKLIMQSGVGLHCIVGLPMAELLSNQLGLSPEQLALADALILDGMPVDDPKAAIVPDGARVALAAGLPGIAGLSMRSDSAVKVLRATITHLKQEEPDPRPGRVLVYLYSLVLPLLAEHFLSRGVLIKGDQFHRYARFAPDDLCLFESQTLPASELAWKLEALAAEEFSLTTHFAHAPNGAERRRKAIRSKLVVREQASIATNLNRTEAGDG